MSYFFIGNSIFRRGGGSQNWSSYCTLRNNTVGRIAVTPQSYDTNNNATWKTVGAEGADYTNLQTAYDAAPSGSVIEIIDDTFTLGARLNISKSPDGNGKAIKIKGKSTKTTLNLYNITIPIRIYNSATAAVEFENIIFVSSQPEAIYSYQAVRNGFVHFINCEFKLTGGYLEFWNSKETVIDGCVFSNTGNRIIYNRIDDTAAIDCKLIINNCTIVDAGTADNLIFNSKTGSIQWALISITNSVIGYTISDTTHNYKVIDYRGNWVLDSLRVGAEATGLAIQGYTEYNPLTAYTVGILCYYLGNLWSCIQESTGNAPALGSEYWEIAVLTSGTIENNLIGQDGVERAFHGMFIGFGTGNISIKNNIVCGYQYNYVIKGYNNTIEYNCAGLGYKGFSIFANDQASFRNNTSRCEEGSALEIGCQDTGGTGIINTAFKYNIFTNQATDDYVFVDNYLRWEPVPEFNNEFLMNFWFGDGVKTLFETIKRILPTELTAFKMAINDSFAEYVDPEFSGSDATTENYYKPNATIFNQRRDDLLQAIGAVDYKK